MRSTERAFVSEELLSRAVGLPGDTILSRTATNTRLTEARFYSVLIWLRNSLKLQARHSQLHAVCVEWDTVEPNEYTMASFEEIVRVFDSVEDATKFGYPDQVGEVRCCGLPVIMMNHSSLVCSVCERTVATLGRQWVVTKWGKKGIKLVW